MPAEQNFTLLKKCRFDIEIELMEALKIKRPKPSLNLAIHKELSRSCRCFIEKCSC